MSQAIFLPVIAMVGLTTLAFFRLAVARARAAQSATSDPSYYRAFLGAPEPEDVVVAVRHYGNLFEAPILVYIGCLSAYVLQAVSIWTLAFAWGYVFARTLQSAIHLTYNNPAHRGLAFALGWLMIIALWATIGGSIIVGL